MIAKSVDLVDDIVNCSTIIINCLRNNGSLILFGNGGSAADAQHIAAEFVGLLRVTDTRGAFNAIALTTNTSVITALVNDAMFTELFSRQLTAVGRPGDVVIGISTSGTSENVINGLLAAKKGGMHTIGFTGETGGKIVDIADLTIKMPSKDTPRIQEGHITIGHILCDVVMKTLQEDMNV